MHNGLPMSLSIAHTISRTKLYALLLAGCVAGYVWLAINVYYGSDGPDSPNVCVIRNVTGYPCPSCGSTRAILAMVHGHVLQALYLNPIGILLFGVLLVAPVWLAYDLINGKDTFHQAYYWLEQLARRRGVAIVLILLVAANWIWNIKKGM